MWFQRELLKEQCLLDSDIVRKCHLIQSSIVFEWIQGSTDLEKLGLWAKIYKETPPNHCNVMLIRQIITHVGIKKYLT